MSVALRDVGITARQTAGTHRTACPECAKQKRRPGDDALAVTIKRDGAAIWYCHRCGWKGHLQDETATIHAGKRLSNINKPDHQHERLSPWGRDLWRDCRPISDGDTAARYIEARGCALPHPDGDLRWHPHLKHPSGYVGPALIGLVTDATSNTPITLHRTWIRKDGSKTDVTPPRLYLADHRKQGGVVRLWPDDCVTLGLGLAEGIETALALARVFAPVWSALDAGNLAGFPALDGIESLTVAVDHDEAGINAALACGQRWRSHGREARVIYAKENGADLCDAAPSVTHQQRMKEVK